MEIDERISAKLFCVLSGELSNVDSRLIHLLDALHFWSNYRESLSEEFTDLQKQVQKMLNMMRDQYGQK